MSNKVIALTICVGYKDSASQIIHARSVTVLFYRSKLYKRPIVLTFESEVFLSVKRELDFLAGF